MKSRNARWLVGAGVALLAWAPAWIARAQQPDHHDHHAGHSGMELNHGKKWKSDAPLRAGIKQVRQGLKDRKPETIHAAVQSIIKNCKLSPKADQTLHVVLSQILDGAERMKATATADAGVKKVEEALVEYGKHFE